jgi:hypothetical protein
MNALHFVRIVGWRVAVVTTARSMRRGCAQTGAAAAVAKLDTTAVHERLHLRMQKIATLLYTNTVPHKSP